MHRHNPLRSGHGLFRTYQQSPRFKSMLITLVHHELQPDETCAGKNDRLRESCASSGENPLITIGSFSVSAWIIAASIGCVTTPIHDLKTSLKHSILESFRCTNEVTPTVSHPPVQPHHQPPYHQITNSSSAVQGQANRITATAPPPCATKRIEKVQEQFFLSHG